MQNSSSSSERPNVTPIRRGDDRGHDFNWAVTKLSKLSEELNAIAEGLRSADMMEPPVEIMDFYAAVRAYEIFLIERALRWVGGSQLEAARLLNLKHTTLHSKIKTLKIDLSNLKPPTAESMRSRLP